jgi:hypothetical protein
MIPVVSLFVIWLALVFVTLSALSGDRLFVSATVMISFMNIVFFSPLTIGLLLGDTYTPVDGKGFGLLYITIALFAAPIVAIIVNATGTFALNRPSREHRVVLGQ